MGYGVLVNANNLQYVSKVDAKKTTYTICEVKFSREYPASSSLTGRKSTAFKDMTTKPKRQEEKVFAIVG